MRNVTLRPSLVSFDRRFEPISSVNHVTFRALTANWGVTLEQEGRTDGHSLPDHVGQALRSAVAIAKAMPVTPTMVGGVAPTHEAIDNTEQSEAYAQLVSMAAPFSLVVRRRGRDVEVSRRKLRKVWT
jgi:hypothetical protein